MDTPPPIQSPARKSLHPLAWLGIGCGGLILLIVIGGVIFTVLFGSKIAKFAEEVEKNPAKIVEFALKFDPNLEVVSSDEAAQTITIRDKRTGKTVTLSHDDIRNGKLSVITEDGETTINAGPADVSSLPQWVQVLVPVGAQASGAFSSTSNGTSAGTVTFQTATNAEETASQIKETLENAGFDVQDSSAGDAPEGVARSITGTSSQPVPRTFSAVITGSGSESTVVVSYEEKGAQE